jgi:hypothetical protein
MPEETVQRVDLAAEQLDVALQLFLDRRSFISALTLAGAAEEILGKALLHRGMQNSLEHKFEAMAPIHQLLHRKPLARKAFVDDENKARNAAKHMGAPSDTSVTADLEDAAIWMIVRAIDNFERLNLPRTDLMRAFDTWFHENVVGT